MKTADHPLIGKTLHGNLLVTSFIGSGAMGSVYVAEHVNLPGKRFAIKVLRSDLTNEPGFQERFFQEADNQAQLSHPNIVDVVDYFEENDCYFLVQSFVDGRSLDAVIEQDGPLPEARALPIFGGILEGLDCAHKHGIIHRDIKPSNVLIDRSDRALISDFGIAIRAGTTRMTSTGMAVGTPEYMSPEQIVRPHEIDHRSDVYSAGIVLYEMLTGKLPFDGGTEFAIKEQQVKNAPKDPRKFNPMISAGMVKIIYKALEKDPAKRYAGCQAFLGDIKAYQGGTGHGGGNPRIGIALAAGVLVVAAGAAVRFWPAPSDSPPPPAPSPAPEPSPAVAFALVGTARQALGYFCQSLEAIPGKREGKRIAAQIGDSARAESFDKQIAEIEANAKDYVSQYGANMQSLAELDDGMVRKALSDAASVAQQRWQSEVARDYTDVKGGHPITQAGMQADCTLGMQRPKP